MGDDFKVLDVRLILKKERTNLKVIEQIAGTLSIVIGPTVGMREQVIAQSGSAPVLIEDILDFATPSNKKEDV